jgi:DNA-binding response OmpR family regulator
MPTSNRTTTTTVATETMKKIMIIDDETNIIDLLSFFLKKAGFEPVGYTDGLVAISDFATKDFSFVITDMHMPRITGLDVILKLKNIKKEVPIAVVTGFSDVSEEQLLASGAVAVFSKPINYPELTKIIREQLG